MTMLTVDDLARDLKVKNDDLLRHLVTMGYDVHGPESPLETDDPAALRAELVTVLPQREVVEKRIKPTVIRRRVKQKAPEVEGPPVEAAEGRAEEQVRVAELKRAAVQRPSVEKAAAKEPVKKDAKKGKKATPARIIEKAPKTPPAEAPTRAPKEAKVKEAAPKSAVKPAIEAAEKVGTRVAGPSQEASSIKQASAREAALAAPESAEALIERETEEEKIAKRKKKKEKRLQPAQIIGRVELKKEAEKEVAPEPEPAPPAPRPKAVPIVEVAEVVVPLPGETLAEAEARQKKKKKEKRAREGVEESLDEDRVKVKRRKEVLLRDDLYDDRRPGRLRGRAKKAKPRKTEITTPKAIKRRIRLPEVITVSNLAHRMSTKAADVVQNLLSLGVTATMNEQIDFDTATLVANELGFETEALEQSEKDLLPTAKAETAADLRPRPPVVTMMGHVDHGKTSLLDYIRSAHVTDQEAGGITQHIGAYKARLERGDIVFLDTPGHEAFTAMRARGAHVTDFVVLVVAADDGVMDQTREAINHARAAKAPIVVAVNKIDKPEADRDRVVRELSELELIPEAWGGDTLFAYVSAKTGEGVSDLLDLILLQAEIMELKANPNKPAVGTVIEARLDKGRGPVATVLVRDGALKVGDPFVAGVHYGKVRAMFDHEGNVLKEAGPATPVEVQGASGVPDAGEPFIVVDEEKVAKQIGLHRQQKLREKEVAGTAGPASLEELMARMQAEEALELNLILKADVQGSVEALKEALQGASGEKVHVKIIHSGVGTVTESDVMLAAASRAIIIGFNVRPDPKTAQLAEEKHVDVRLYTVIYEALQDVRKAMEGLLAPVLREEVVGHAEVRQIFTISRIGAIAGCYITSGKIQRTNSVRLIRDGVVVYEGKISSMKRHKDDIKESSEGFECGILLQNFNDIKVGDVIEAFTIQEEAATLT
ncbi:MAG: translation initiation factor IF-2 [Deltaproteobacteria bacterium]|nr:translation initiation factor IF-2 [Deltaproteobacteria bacterium]